MAIRSLGSIRTQQRRWKARAEAEKRLSTHFTHVRSELAELNIELKHDKKTGKYYVFPIDVTEPIIKTRLTILRDDLYEAWEAGKEMAAEMVAAHVEYLEDKLRKRR